MKKYEPQKIESKWKKIWEREPLNQAVDFDKREKFYALVEFPYPSGEGLHMGHAFTCTLLDVLARQKRMAGFNVLHPMGWDAFGLPTENYAIKSGIHPRLVTAKNTARFRAQMKRLGLSYDWRREVNTTDPDYYHWTQWIFLQLFKHGLAYKTETGVGWCPKCRIVLANEEIVKGKCERCGAGAEQRRQKQWLLRITAYADRLAEELDLVDYPDYVKASQRNWIGRSEGVNIRFVIANFNSRRKRGLKSAKAIEVFTTRLDTLFGVTAMVLAPEHPFVASLLNSKLEDTSEVARQRPRLLRGGGIGERRYVAIKAYLGQAKKKSELERTELQKEKTGVFTGLYCINPINNESIPIWVGDYVVAGYGGGAVMVVPGHDQRDFEFAKRYKLPIKTVIKPSSTPSYPLSKAFEEDGVLVNSGKYTGLTSEAARKAIVKDLAKEGGARRAVNYHLRDWIFSRQHYWGEPIPMVYCEACAKKGKTFHLRGGKATPPREMAGWFPLNEDELPLELPKVERYQPTGTGESPLASIKSWIKVACPECGRPARRETDTMPNWAGSSWYYLAYVFGYKLGKQKAKSKKQKWEKENVFGKHKDLLNYWLPVDLYLGGAEHTTLHLLYSRFWHKFLNDIGAVPGKEPYQARRQHGVILAEDGRRMSKSRGNVINPEEVIKKYGSDTLRVYLMFMGPYEATMPWSSRGVVGAYRFLKRLWRLVDQCLPLRGGGVRPPRNTSPREHPQGGVRFHPEGGGIGGVEELAAEEQFFLHKTIKKVTEDIETLSFNTAIAALMELVNFLSKKPIEDTSLESIEVLVKLLAPFAPFMAEELWESLRPSLINADQNADQCRLAKAPRNTSPREHPQGGVRFHPEGGGRSIHLQPWPKYNPKFIKEEKTIIVIQVNGRIRDKIEVSSGLANFSSPSDKEKVKRLALGSERVKRCLKAKELKRFIFVPRRLVNLVTN